ncbi:hypothetical protein BDV95DRAFT_488594 [Massariosphaeria phaeospora]|uniref:DUF8004 domain-containing protein n=1 Tax=Massariosphaeria phaeospora TaxID=100035 RepID=A0A7C8IH68_9PLEO|nr:hypothetical protein BDV95DRAFT_488594 [Massariosphaeria phaeospora]
MVPDKKRQSHRLSSIFSIGSTDSHESGSGSLSPSDSGGRLTRVRNRISSATHLTPDYPPPPAPTPSPRQLPTIQTVDTTLATLEPPPPISAPRSRSASPAGARLKKLSRPGTPNADANGLLTPTPTGAEGGFKKLRRRSRLFGGGGSVDESAGKRVQSPLAWVAGHRPQVDYNLTMLLNGERVDELWDEEGDTLVYLFPRTSGKGASFRIDSSLYGASNYMTRLVHGRLYSDATIAPTLPDRTVRNSGGNYGSSRATSPDLSMPEGSSDGSKGSRTLSDVTEDDHTEKHLYMPIALTTDNSPISPSDGEARLTTKDIDTLVTYRNFFAFLRGERLVATERHPDIFDIFMRISDVLQHYQFSNLDGSNFGEVAASSFDSYVDELILGDVRTSREKTIEAIVLGERMRSLSLYTEGFVHAAGKFDDIKEMQHPKFNFISSKTATRIARASLDLDQRENNINAKLRDFDFPGLFSGIMNSDTADEKKTINFKNWRAAFMTCRSFVMHYYKTKYGSWLPKAKSKKNSLTTSGLNRLVLLEMYRDFSSLYDLLVDRTNLTSRTADGFMNEDEGGDFVTTAIRALRKVLSEYDRSIPPVQPPIPFDVPLYPPHLSTGDSKKDVKARSKKLKGDDAAKLLKETHNPDAEQHTAFLDAFRHFELKHTSGSTLDEFWEFRTGVWLFIYSVLQSLPMLVIDAPGVRFTEGVEYFLCEVPRSGIPWAHDNTIRARTWFGVAGGSQVVSLPTDIVEHGVEGVFRRSHCWKMAENWSQDDVLLNAAVHEINASPLLPPPSLLDPASPGGRGRSQSPDRRRESVMNLGLEALPLPPGVAPMNPPIQRPDSRHDPNKTFDAMFASADTQTKSSTKKDKKKK